MSNKKTLILIIAIIIFLVLSTLIYRLVGYEIIGTDPYMRLVRIEALLEENTWYDDTIYDSNAPYGETLHWTKPLDLLIIALSLPLGLLSKNPLFLSSIIISPILGTLTIISLYSISSMFLKHKKSLLLVVLSSLPFYQLFGLGTGDHHSLLLLVFTGALALFFHLLQDKDSMSSIGLGVLLALGMWVSVEFLILVIGIFFILMLLFLIKKDYIKQMLHVSISLTLFSGLFLLLEEPMNHLTIIYDSLSIVYLVTFALMTCTIALIYLTYKKYVKNHILYSFLYAIIGITSLVMIFPNLIQGPFNQVNDEIINLWLSKVKEVQPMFSFHIMDIGQTLFYLGLPLLVLVIYIYKLIRKKMNMYESANFLLLLIFFSLTLYQRRWVGYTVIISVIPLASILSWLLDKNMKAWIRGPIVVLYLMGFSMFGLVIMSYDSSNQQLHLDTEGICNELKIKDGIIASFIDFGPELLYRTEMKVIATPYHRNHSGMLYMYEIMKEKDMSALAEKLEHRAVDYILIAPGSSEEDYYIQEEESFYHLLKSNQLPSFITEVYVSTPNFRLFKVE